MKGALEYLTPLLFHHLTLHIPRQILLQGMRCNVSCRVITVFLIQNPFPIRILFHRHGYYKNFSDALDQIRSHGNYQINTRWKGKSYKNGLMR